MKGIEMPRKENSVEVPEHIKNILVDSINRPEPIIEFPIRKKNIKSYVSNLFLMRTALILDLIEPDLLDWIDGMQ
jgi:hypothetical protein